MSHRPSELSVRPPLDVRPLLARQAERERGQLNNLFMQAPVAIAMLEGPEHKFTLANHEYLELVGRRAVLGKSVREALPEIAASGLYEILDQVYLTGQPYQGRELDLGVTQLDGSTRQYVFNFNYQPWRDARGLVRGILVSANDVSAEVRARRLAKETEHSLQNLVAEFEAERDLRERFVSALTHDLRNPLTAVRLCAQLITHKLGDESALMDLAERIQSNLTRADLMIRDLLDANRLRAGEGIPVTLAPCRLDQCLPAWIQELRLLHGPLFELSNSVGPVEGHWDAEALRRVLENLAGNAVKYGTAQSTIQIGLHSGADWVELSVHNQGNPIPATDQPTLFRHYRRTDSAVLGGQKGWGIGLTLVRGITEAHGGTVRVESSPTLGTTFYVRLALGLQAQSA